MKILPDGNVLIEKGEPFPFVCPQCKFPKEFETAADYLRCEECGFSGTVARFSEYDWVWNGSGWDVQKREKLQ